MAVNNLAKCEMAVILRIVEELAWFVAKHQCACWRAGLLLCLKIDINPLAGLLVLHLAGHHIFACLNVEAARQVNEENVARA